MKAFKAVGESCKGCHDRYRKEKEVMTARPGRHAGSRIFAAPLLGLIIAARAGGIAPAGQIERGRYLVHAGGCISCHTADRPDAIAARWWPTPGNALRDLLLPQPHT